MTFWLLKLQISKLKTVYRMFEHFHKRKLSLGGGYNETLNNQYIGRIYQMSS